MINWRIRAKNKTFWLAIVPAMLLLIQVVAVPFGYDFKIEGLNHDLTAIVNAIFGFLSILGVVSDPTTKGVKDSEQALEYTKAGESRVLNVNPQGEPENPDMVNTLTDDGVVQLFQLDSDDKPEEVKFNG